MVEKEYLSAQQLLEDSFSLGAKIVASGFKPSFMIAIWRGGVPVGIAVQEILAYSGIKTDHIAIRTSSYAGHIDERSSDIRIHSMSYLIKNITAEDRLLIVDDVFDTGHTIQAVISHLREKARRNTPLEIQVATPYYQPEKRQVDIMADYYLHETDQWLVFPHELDGLTIDEIKENKQELIDLIDDILPIIDNR